MRHPTDDRVWEEYVHETNATVLGLKVAIIEAYSCAAARGLLHAAENMPHDEALHGIELIELILKRLSSEERSAYDALAGWLAQVPEGETLCAYGLAACDDQSPVLGLPSSLLLEVNEELRLAVHARLEHFKRINTPDDHRDPLANAYYLFLDRLHQLVFFALTVSRRESEEKNTLRLVSSREESALEGPRAESSLRTSHLRLVR